MKPLIPEDVRQPLINWRNTSALWLSVVLATPICLWVFDLKIYPLMVTLLLLTQITAVLTALSTTWHGSAILSSTLLIILLSYMAEWVGSSTGIPFGEYEYSQALQPQIGGIPLIIPLAWVMMLIPSWGITQLILEPYQPRLGKLYPVLFAALSGLAFTAWDFYLDPQMVGLGLWSWQTPGPYYGIPLLNYVGWWLISTLITVIIRPNNLPYAPLLLIYTITWLFQAIGTGIFINQPGPALTGFIVMGIITLWAWRQLSTTWDSVLQYLPFQRSSIHKSDSPSTQ